MSSCIRLRSCKSSGGFSLEWGFSLECGLSMVKGKEEGGKSGSVGD